MLKTKNKTGIDLETLASRDYAQADQMVDAINHSSGVARGLYLAFISLTAFLFVITGTTDDVDLLLRTPINLPIFGVGVDLEAFYRFAPWVYALAHINMMMVLVLLSRKLSIFHSKLAHQPFLTREILRNRLHVFAPVQYLSKQHDGILKLALWFISRVMLVWIPPATILWLQIDSLAMQEDSIVWFQRVALLVDTFFVYFLWTRMMQGEARSIAEVRLPGSRRPKTTRMKKQRKSTAFAMLFILTISFFGAMIPLSSWEQFVANAIRVGAPCNPDNPDVIRTYPIACSNPVSAFFFDGFYKKIERIDNNSKPGINTIVKEGEGKTLSLEKYKLTRFYRKRCGNSDEITASQAPNIDKHWYTKLRLNCWFNGTRHLDEVTKHSKGRLKNIYANAKAFNLEEFSKKGFGDKRVIESKNNSVLFFEDQNYRFINLPATILNWLSAENADFSGANLSRSLLNGANLYNAKLIKTNLYKISLVGAHLGSANLIGASLFRANMQKSDLVITNFQGADLSEAKLQGVDLWAAELQGANLSNAELQDANLSDAELQDANLSDAELQDANLSDAELQGANLWAAELQGVDLSGAELQGVDLSGAELQGANLSDAELQGVDLSGAELQGANLSFAALQGANLNGAELQGVDLWAAELQGANLSFAALQGVDLTRAELQGAIVDDTYLDFANLSDSEYSKNWDFKQWCIKKPDSFFPGRIILDICKDWLANGALKANPSPFKKYLISKGVSEEIIKRIETRLSKNIENSKFSPVFVDLQENPKKESGECFGTVNFTDVPSALQPCEIQAKEDFYVKRAEFLCEYTQNEAENLQDDKLLDLIISPKDRKAFNLISERCPLTKRAASLDIKKWMLTEKHISLFCGSGKPDKQISDACFKKIVKAAQKRADEFFDKQKGGKGK